MSKGVAAVVVGLVLPVSVCSGGCRRPAGPPPTALALVLEVQDNSVNLLSATPTGGGVGRVSMNDRLGAVRRRDSLWIEYTMRGAGDAVLATGGFPVAMRAIVEPSNIGKGGTVRVPNRVVMVRVQHAPDASSIVFSRVEPSDSPPEKWSRVSMGTSALRGAGR